MSPAPTLSAAVLPRRPDELAERLLNWRWKRPLRRLQGRDDLRREYLPHGGSCCPRGLGWRLSRSQHERTRREDGSSKFYEISDNLVTRTNSVTAHNVPDECHGCWSRCMV